MLNKVDILAVKTKKMQVVRRVVKITPRIIRRRRWYAALKTRPPRKSSDLLEHPIGFSGGGINVKRLKYPKPKKVPKGPFVAKVHKGTPPKGVKPLNENYSALYNFAWTGQETQNGIVTQNTGGNYNFSNVKKRTGVTNPNWKRIIRSGGNATTVFNGEISMTRVIRPFNHTAVWNDPPPAVVRHVEVASGFPYWYNVACSAPSASDPTALGQASKFFLQRLQKTRQAMQGGIFTGEMRETFRMLRRPAKTLFDELPKYLDSLSKRKAGALRKSTARSKSARLRHDFKRAAQLKKIAADTWLEFSFGWKPLISDIQDALTAIGRIGENSYRQQLSATGTNKVVDYNGGTTEAPIADQFVTWIKFSKQAVTDYSCQIRGAVKINSTVSSISRRNELFGFTPEQFIPTLWELLPWSFLVDYFTNIGDILNAGAVNTADIAWTSRTQRAYRSVMSDACVSPKTGSNIAASLDPGKVERYSKVISRDAGGPVVPQFRWSIPSFLTESPTGDKDLNTQWVNIAALASKYFSLRPFHK
jgi:hypothetical protein